MATFQIFQSKDFNYRWRLRANNNEIVAVSEGYETKYGAKQSAELVKRLSWLAGIIEI